MGRNVLLLLFVALFSGTVSASSGEVEVRSVPTVQCVENLEQITAKPEPWQQCWSYSVQNCCGLNGIACGDSYASVVAMIESLISSFCPTCSCEP